MTKEQFLEGREFKTHENSDYRYRLSAIGNIEIRHVSDSLFRFHTYVAGCQTTDKTFEVYYSILSNNHYATIYFKDLILV